MDIILWDQQEKINSNCIIRYGRGVKAGEIACGFTDSGEKAIFIGVGDVEAETYEDGLFCGLKKAMVEAEGKGYKNIEVDIDSFVTDPSLVSYILNEFIDYMVERRLTSPFFEGKIYLRYTAHQADKSLLEDVENVIFAPIKVNKAQSFGDYGDPLKKEFQEFLEGFSEQKTFREHLLDLIDKKGFRKYSVVYKKCGISKSTFSKIINFALPDYKPSKSTVAAFAIGLELDLPEAQKLFHAAGYHLDRTEKMDQILRFFIEKKIFDIQEINYCMNYLGVPLLGEHSRDDGVRIAKNTREWL